MAVVVCASLLVRLSVAVTVAVLQGLQVRVGRVGFVVGESYFGDDSCQLWKVLRWEVDQVVLRLCKGSRRMLHIASGNSRGRDGLRSRCSHRMTSTTAAADAART